MKKPHITSITLYATLAVLMTTPAFAKEPNSLIPFGGYQKNGKCGCYGAKATIKTAAEARKVIEGFLIGHDLHIGFMDERPGFFRVELVDGNGTVRDVVIVHKNNGRVRSTY
ncbi:hypothetical protein [Geobacter sp. SVR]|uniref:hypothetical protein n=1 Tax=Geobacter sp. SVR TaxID=2495594 RepID=UPI0015664C76|nr:hypothetical protein [Geobacter sp. SVR]